jgi:hypothetical protein
VVLPEDLCRRLAELAEAEARTVSNMARVLIQQGVERLEGQRGQPSLTSPAAADAVAAERFRQQLERQRTRRLRAAPRRLRLQRPD